MNVSDFTSLLQQPERLESAAQTRQLEEVVEAYPWFQAARALHLKGLKNDNSYKYNQALKETAACTADREILFEFITSEAFLQNSVADSISGRQALEDQEIVSEDVEPNPDRDTGMIDTEEDSPLPRNTEEAEQILDPKLFRSVDPEVDKALEARRAEAREALEMGRPLAFDRSERYSFSEWLQLTSFKKRTGAEEAAPPAESAPEAEDPKARKFELIDRFIAENPKIVPKPGETSKVDIDASVQLNKQELMTETLARVYLEQGKYKKAVQAYRILSLKYPEKSGFFADQIKAVQKLQDDKPKKKK
ncbi:hypothetical protein OZ410_06185 [Robiginitalea sp. M366]|uniref:hypothetical protein n=1 Tax=Robiginitalea aestuariiviva TaxID=3036903 RepID=UPI00240D5952|nr:hypothetical protein [Robiginitalea aestuariiviva]MDG1571897.1 hypothetical protein [Robiginitalea aestuariiviva]